MTARRRKFFVLLRNARDASDFQPCFVQARTRRVAIRRAKRAAIEHTGIARWITDSVAPWAMRERQTPPDGVRG